MVYVFGKIERKCEGKLMKNIILKKGSKIWLYAVNDKSTPRIYTISTKQIEFKESELFKDVITGNYHYIFHPIYPTYENISISSMAWNVNF